MKELVKDIGILINKHKWKIISILVVGYLVVCYPDIKAGIMGGWLNK